MDKFIPEGEAKSCVVVIIALQFAGAEKGNFFCVIWEKLLRRNSPRQYEYEEVMSSRVVSCDSRTVK